MLQNQQVQRFERDLERTSKQLQMEISILQKNEPAYLNEQVLTEIDDLFQQAEDYFTNKQEVQK